MPIRLRVAFVGLLVLGASRPGQEADAPLRFRAGPHTYEWVRGFGERSGKALGNTHGCIVVDREDRVYLCTDSEDAVVVFDTDGRVLRTFGRELAGGLHGLALVDGEEQTLLMAHLGRHQVIACSLSGEILWTVDYPRESGLYARAEEYLPTSVAPLPDGGFLVADGYGRSWIHRYDAQHVYRGSFGGPGTELGRLQTPHGLWLDVRGAEPVLLVADRENHRLQVFSLSGEPLRAVGADGSDLLRRPCHMHPFADELVVADLAGRVTVLDAALGLVAHLGENPDPSKTARNDVPREDWRDGEFLAPHCANWDSHGNLYVTDWVASGRISKLARIE